MSLDLGRLMHVRELANGIIQAQCPACAEGGHDRAGEHLLIHSDGRYGCCVYPKDRDHRKRIFALAGDRTPRQFTVKVSHHQSPLNSAQSVTASLTQLFGTLGTGICESAKSGITPKGANLASKNKVGTLGTPFSMSRAYAREGEMIINNTPYTCKDWEKGVPSVPNPPTVRDGRDGVVGHGEGVEQPPRAAEQQGRMPYFTPGGTLVIPFDSPERFHWWKLDGHRQSVKDTIAELRRIPPDK